MTNRLSALEDELAPEQADQDDDREEDQDEDEQVYVRGSSATRRDRRTARRRRLAAHSSSATASPALIRARAAALAAERPIRYRVPGLVPAIGATGTMNAWAAMVAMLLSWRERASIGVEEALGRLGPRFVDLFHRNQGLAIADKADLLAAAGLAANPPARLDAEDVEMLLRESGPLWISDDDRAGRLVSLRPLLVCGISGRAGGAQLEAIDPVKGRHVAVSLRRLTERLGRRVQVMHLGQGAPHPAFNGGIASPGSLPPVAVAQAYYVQAMNPAVLIPLVGPTYTIFKDVAGIGAGADITLKLDKMEGYALPNDDAAFKTKAPFNRAVYTYPGASIKNGLFQVQNIPLTFRFDYNGYGVGSVSLTPGQRSDAFAWKLNVSAEINAPASLGSADRRSVELIIRYEHSRAFADNETWQDRLLLNPDGTVTPTGHWLGEGSAESLAADPEEARKLAERFPPPGGQVTIVVERDVAGASSFNVRRAFAEPAPLAGPQVIRGSAFTLTNRSPVDVTVDARTSPAESFTRLGTLPRGMQLTIAPPMVQSGAMYELVVSDAGGAKRFTTTFWCDATASQAGGFVD